MSSDYSKLRTNDNKVAGSTQFTHSVPLNGSSLGTTTERAATPVNTTVEQTTESKIHSTATRYKLQKYAQQLHPNSRISACLKTISPGQNFVTVHYNEETHHAHYQNLMTCDNVWLCPVCSGRITSQRAEEIRRAYSYAIDTLGFRVVMVTYTLSHNRWDDLADLVVAIRGARKKMRSGRRWQEFKTNYGYVGAIASFEVTHGDNSWHPHVHEIMILDNDNALYDLDNETPDELLQSWLEHDLKQEWCNNLAKVGRSASLEHGLDVKTTSKYVGQYLAKYGKLPSEMTWDIALEVAKGNKKSNSEGLHPFSILAKAFDDGLTEAERKQYRALWYEYADVFSGQKQIFWTSGLKDLLLVDEPGDDESESEVVMVIARHTWSFVVQNNMRAEVLAEVLRVRGDKHKLKLWIDKQKVLYKLRKRSDGRASQDATH